MEIFEVQAGSNAAARAHAARVLRAYFDAERARDSRRVLWWAIPVLALLLVGVEAATGLITRMSVYALGVLSTATLGGARFREWRATRTLLRLIDRRDAAAPGLHRARAGS